MLKDAHRNRRAGGALRTALLLAAVSALASPGLQAQEAPGRWGLSMEASGAHMASSFAWMAGAVASAQMAMQRVEATMPLLGTTLLHMQQGGWQGDLQNLEVTAPPAWLPQDPADSLYRAARGALNRGDTRAAARDFQQIRTRYPSSGYVGDSFYYEAFALSRSSNESDLRQGLALLDQQAANHPAASTIRDAAALRVRIRASLASMGDAGAAQQIRETAGQTPCTGPEQETRMMALSALLNMDAGRAVPILQEVLASRDACSAELRRRAVFLIAQQDSPETVDLLLDLAHRNPDPDAEVRRQAVFWLSEVEGEASIQALESILHDSDDEALRERALFAMSQHNSERAAGILADYAGRSDAPGELRSRAIFWIGQNRGGAAAIRALYPTLDTDAMREQAIFAASQAGGSDPAARAWLIERARDRSESIEVRKKAIFWAAESGMAPADLAGLYGTTDDIEIREQIIFALSQASGEGAVEALIAVTREETDPNLRRRAVFWLGQMDDPRAAEYLLELIRSGGGGV